MRSYDGHEWRDYHPDGSRGTIDSRIQNWGSTKPLSLRLLRRIPYGSSKEWPELLGMEGATVVSHGEDLAGDECWCVVTPSALPDPPPVWIDCSGGFKVWVSPAKGFAPVQWECYTGKGELAYRTKVTRWRVDGDIVLPVAGETYARLFVNEAAESFQIEPLKLYEN